jgi:uncharacterized membrane protein YgaE (UPF0421/DUF939 family)
MKIVKFLMVQSAILGSALAMPLQADWVSHLPEYQNEIEQIMEAQLAHPKSRELGFVYKIGITEIEKNVKKEIKKIQRKIEEHHEDNQYLEAEISEWEDAEWLRELKTRNLEQVTRLTDELPKYEELLRKIQNLKSSFQ